MATYYVSPSGNNSNSGLTTALPWATLAHAQSSSSGGDTILLMTGTFSSFPTLHLQFADSNKSFLAAPGATPILDGGGTSTGAFQCDNGCSGVTIDHITMQNFANFAADNSSPKGSVIYANGSNYTFTNNTITLSGGGFTDQAGIYMSYTISGVNKIANNKITSMQGPGISIATGVGDPGITGSVSIDSNIVETTCLAVSDQGAIYVYDSNGTGGSTGGTGTGVTITNNVVGNWGNAGNSVGIYLDDNTNHVLVSGNQVWGTGHQCLLIHGGGFNTIQNNVFDITNCDYLALNQASGLKETYNMQGNVFKNNIICSTAANPTHMWETLTSTLPYANPTVQNNLYFLSGGAYTLSSNGFTETGAITGNPGFTSMSGHNYTLAANSLAFGAPVSFSPLVTTQGPSGVANPTPTPTPTPAGTGLSLTPAQVNSLQANVTAISQILTSAANPPTTIPVTATQLTVLNATVTGLLSQIAAIAA